MEYVNLGRTGVKVSRIGLGCMTYGTPKWRPWVLDEDASRPFFRRALYYRDDDFAVVDRVTEAAKGRGVPNAQVARAWLLHQPGVTAPIVGASKPHHLDDALAALEVKLDPVELKSLEEPYRPHPVLGHS